MQWLEWLEKKTYSGLSPKQQKIMNDIDGEKREDPYAKEVSLDKEQPLDELTDGKLEEVEKLKSWESWLVKTINQFSNQQEKKPSTGGLGQDINYMGGTKQEPLTQNVPIKNPKGNLGGKTKLGKDGVVKIPRKITTNDGSVTSQGGRRGGDKRGGEGTAGGKVTMDSTRAMLAHVLGDKKEDNPDKKLGEQKDTSNLKEWQKRVIRQGGKLQNKSWESWLTKQQGAGDARYGNQHLTGLEQEPIADDENTGLTTDGDNHDKPYKESSKKKDE